MRWWESGLIGGVVLSITTVVNAIEALLDGIDDTVPWTAIFGVCIATFLYGISLRRHSLVR